MFSFVSSDRLSWCMHDGWIIVQACMFWMLWITVPICVGQCFIYNHLGNAQKWSYHGCQCWDMSAPSSDRLVCRALSLRVCAPVRPHVQPPGCFLVPPSEKVARASLDASRVASQTHARGVLPRTPNLPKIMPTKICWLKTYSKFPMGLGIPPLEIKIMLESNPLTSRILVRRLGV